MYSIHSHGVTYNADALEREGGGGSGTGGYEAEKCFHAEVNFRMCYFFCSD